MLNQLKSSTLTHMPAFNGSDLIEKIEQILQERSAGDAEYYRNSVQEVAQLIGLSNQEWRQAKRGEYLFKDQFAFSALLTMYQQLILNGGNASC